MNIFEVQRNKQNRNFVIKNGNLELEVFADIIETCKEIPFVGSIIKLGTVAVNYMDWRYVTKLSKFLESSDELSEDVVNKYIVGKDTESDGDAAQRHNIIQAVLFLGSTATVLGLLVYYLIH